MCILRAPLGSVAVDRGKRGGQHCRYYQLRKSKNSRWVAIASPDAPVAIPQHQGEQVQELIHKLFIYIRIRDTLYRYLKLLRYLIPYIVMSPVHQPPTTCYVTAQGEWYGEGKRAIRRQFNRPVKGDEPGILDTRERPTYPSMQGKAWTALRREPGSSSSSWWIDD